MGLIGYLADKGLDLLKLKTPRLFTLVRYGLDLSVSIGKI